MATIGSTLKHIPILVLSADTHEETILSARRAGANDYLLKDFRGLQDGTLQIALVSKLQHLTGQKSVLV